MKLWINKNNFKIASNVANFDSPNLSSVYVRVVSVDWIFFCFVVCLCEIESAVLEQI